MSDLLSKLAVKYGTDRHPGSKHSYTPFYYNLFKDRRESIKKVLEIGVGEGSGLRMWRGFFPNAMIYGAEVDPKRVFEEDRIKVYLCDQSSKENLVNLISQIGADIDFVVEDGSHLPNDQVFTCQTLMPLLKKDVVYVIEDVADPSIVGELRSYNLELPKLTPLKARYDDRVIIVRH